jgi:hypothetical protein
MHAWIAGESVDKFDDRQATIDFIQHMPEV